METVTEHGLKVDLPIGITLADGSSCRTAMVRKMRGHEEALLYERDLDPASLVTRLLAGTVVRLGDVAEPDAELFGGMYSADRNHLMVQVRRFTLGDRLTAGYGCPGCGATQRTIERLDMLPFRALGPEEDPESITVDLEDGYRDREGAVHTQVRLRLPRGSDEAFVATFAGGDPVAASDALLLRCVQQFGSIPDAALDAYGLKILRDLTLGDRLRLQAALHDDAPGTRLLRELQCDGCGARYERQLDVTDFFVPGQGEEPASERRSSTWPTTSTGAGARS